MTTAPERPRIDPGLLAAFSQGAPKRLVKSLDKDPTLAERWRWERGDDGVVRVATESGETVTLSPDRTGVLGEAAQVACSCLLAPRCLHLLAVLTRLEPSELAVSVEGAAAPPAAATAEAVGVGIELSAEQRRAARDLWQSGVELLGMGASSAGTMVQAELLRAIHGCRGAALPRAASAGLRVLRSIRDLREERPEFSLAELGRDLLELLEVSRELAGPEAETAAPRIVEASALGTARRAYAEIGHLRLHGLFCEPVIAGSGASGVVSYLADEAGQLYSVADLQPGEPTRARGAYEKGVRLGETSLSHRELCREGLFVQGATVSADGRLGSGASVRAVRAGPSAWNAPELVSLFATPIAEQVARAYAAAALPPMERPSGSDLVLTRGVVLGAAGDALLFQAGELVLRFVAASDHAQLPIREALRLLARAPGLELALVGRLRLEQPRTLALLAVGSAPEGQPLPAADPARRLELPATWRGRCNLGLDALQASHLRPGLLPSAPVLGSGEAGSLPDPLAGLRRRLQRLALGGRATLPPEVGAELEREARRLAEAMVPTAATLLRGLHRSALACERTLTGARRSGDPARLARAFLAAGIYERACSRSLQQQAWLV